MVIRNFFSKPAVAETTAEETRIRQQAGAVLVGVRELSAWRQGHIPGTMHIPLGSLSRCKQELGPSREVITICRSGHRSISAVQILQQGDSLR